MKEGRERPEKTGKKGRKADEESREGMKKVTGEKQKGGRGQKKVKGGSGQRRL